MAQIILMHTPPVIKGGSPSYYVKLEGQDGFGTPFHKAKDALFQLAQYQAQGHTITSDPEWKQADELGLFKNRAAVEQ